MPYRKMRDLRLGDRIVENGEDGRVTLLQLTDRGKVRVEWHATRDSGPYIGSETRAQDDYIEVDQHVPVEELARGLDQVMRELTEAGAVAATI